MKANLLEILPPVEDTPRWHGPEEGRQTTRECTH
jgi:hypothetical protein